MFFTLGRNHPKKKFDFILKLVNRMCLGKKEIQILNCRSKCCKTSRKS